MPGEEVRPDALLRGLVRYGLGAVLAKLKKLPLLVRTWPCAALAVESSHLVDLQKNLRRSKRTYVTNSVEHRIPDGGNPGRLFRSNSNPQLAQIGWVLRLYGSQVIRIQHHGRNRTIVGRRVRAKVQFGAIVSVSALLIPLDYIRAVRRFHGRLSFDRANRWLGSPSVVERTRVTLLEALGSRRARPFSIQTMYVRYQTGARIRAEARNGTFRIHPPF